MILKSATGKLATKRHTRDAKRIITTQDYGREKWWVAEAMPIADFAAMVVELAPLLDEPTALGVCGAPRAQRALSCTSGTALEKPSNVLSPKHQRSRSRLPRPCPQRGRPKSFDDMPKGTDKPTGPKLG
jgi:hypothetical protein